MIQISLELPETIFSARRKSPDEFVEEMRLAAAIKWYELGEIPQSKAAEIAGVTRTELLHALALYQVDFMQYTQAELEEELAYGSS
jgi:predicted HTH domain antitoxin